MDWDSLEPGSLNLRVDDNAVASLAELEALICERPDEIYYPEEYAHIPKFRGGYKYYSGTATVGHETEKFLFGGLLLSQCHGALSYLPQLICGVVSN